MKEVNIWHQYGDLGLNWHSKARSYLGAIVKIAIIVLNRIEICVNTLGYWIYGEYQTLGGKVIKIKDGIWK